MLRAEIPVLSFEGENEFVTDIFSFQLYISVHLEELGVLPLMLSWTDTDVQFK